MIIGVKAFLAQIEAIANEAPSYHRGGYGADGTCDCIGLIIGAIRRCGGSWRWTHGSNYAARYQIYGLSKITSLNQLTTGDIVFKARAPGENKYDLPDRYKDSGDLKDYYHVGVVTSVLPLRIRHMTTPEPKVDTSIGKWKYHGWLKLVSRDSDEGMMPATGTGNGGGRPLGELIYIQGGNTAKPVNMRNKASLDGKIIREIPQNSEAELVTYDDKWCRVIFAGSEGYVSTAFVHRQDTSETGRETITVQRAALETIYDAIGDMLGMRG